MSNMKCPVTGVNICRFWFTVLVGFIFVFGYDFLMHGNLLMATYEETPELWRTKEDMEAHFPWMMASQFLTVVLTLFIFTRNYEGKGLREGVRFGIMIGLFMGVFAGGAYAWMPISTELAFAWISVSFFQGLGLGVIYALLYRNGNCSEKEEKDEKEA